MMIVLNSIPLLIVAILVTFIVIFVLTGIRIVQQSETMIVERLGRYHRTLSSGINIIWPVFDRARTFDWRYVTRTPKGETVVRVTRTDRIDLRETVYDFPKQNVITRDNVVLEINALLYFQITDPKRAVYEVANLPDAIEKLTQTTLRNLIGEFDLDQTLSSRDTLNARLRAILDEATDKWGVKITRVELQDIIPPGDVKDTMEKQMRAERNRRAMILEAEGRKRSRILDAEGTRQALMLKADGEAQARIAVAEAEAEALGKITRALQDSGGNPTAYLVAMKHLEVMREMVSGKNNKVVYIPYEATATLASVGAIRDLLGSTIPARNTAGS